MLALLATPAYAQFDPNAGADPRPIPPRHALPSTEPLISAPMPMPRLVFPTNAPSVTTAPSATLSAQAAAAAPFVDTATPQPLLNTQPAFATAPTMVMPVAIAPAVQFPDVDPAVAAEAQRELAVHPATPSYIAPAPNFMPPAPLVAQNPAPLAGAPVLVSPVLARPVTLAPVAPPPSVTAVAPIPAAPAFAATYPILPAPTRAILRSLPARLNKEPKTSANGKLAVNRMTPALKPIADADKVQSYDSVGLSIKVAKPGMDTNFELNRAYTALMGGDTETALTTYKTILASDPTNQDALFGLASTYHRNGNLEQARPYYGELLRVNPNHREGLINFLALVSEESPNEALAELARLEQRNPDFSPIPAQESAVLSKLGYHDQARDKMLRAIELAPENMTYKYNLAVMFDRQNDYADASPLYRLLINASLNGEKLPTTTEALQKRLNYITTIANKPLASPAG